MPSCPWSAEILVVFGITALLYVDTSVSVPSLYKYVVATGGSRALYGVAAAVDSFCGIFFLPLYGYLADRYSPKIIFLVSFVIMAAGGLIYGLATAVGPWAIVVGRFLIGSTSGLRAVGNGFIANYSPPEQRTENLAVAQMIMRVCSMAGPALNILMVAMPKFTIGAKIKFDSYTWCGYFVTVLAIIYFMVVLLVFDPSKTNAGSKSKPQAVTFQQMCTQVQTSRCWVNAHCAYINNFTGQLFTYFLPIYLDREYGYGQVKISYVFCVYSVVGLAAAIFCARASRVVWERTLLLAGQVMIGMGNIGYLIIFGGCYGLGGVENGASAGSSASGPDDWLWDDTGSLPSKYAWQYANESAKSVDNIYKYNDPVTAAAAGAMASEDAYGSEAKAAVVPVWVVILVGSWWNFGGAMQAPGIQGLYAQLVGNRGQGMFQSFFFICNYTGRTLGSWAVGWVAQEFGDCTLWTIATLNYAALWLSFGCNYPRFHPVRIARMNGSNALRGPSGFSTAAAEVTGELADEARSRGEHLQGQIDGGDGARDVASDQPGQELRDPLLGNNTRTENNSDLAATVENLKARLTEQEAQFEALSKRLDAADAVTRSSTARDQGLVQRQEEMAQRQDTMDRTLSGVTARMERLSESVDAVSTMAAAAAAAASSSTHGDGRALLTGPDPKLPSPLHRPGEVVQFSAEPRRLGAELDASVETERVLR